MACNCGSDSGLLLCQIANDRQLKHLVEVGLDHQQHPEKKPGQADQARQREHQHPHERNQLQQHAEYSRCNREHESSDPQIEVLESMKAHEKVALEWFDE